MESSLVSQNLILCGSCKQIVYFFAIFVFGQENAVVTGISQKCKSQYLCSMFPFFAPTFVHLKVNVDVFLSFRVLIGAAELTFMHSALL